MARGGVAVVVVLLSICLGPQGAAALVRPATDSSRLHVYPRGDGYPFFQDGNSIASPPIPAPAALGGAVKDAGKCSEGVLVCVRRDLAADLSAILSAESFNITPSLVVERVEDAGPQRRTPPTLEHVGLPTLAATAIKLFQTHALVWRLWPGVVHLKVFNHRGEGMDAAVEIQPALAARTWGAIAARRRITMALLPIMYKMGVGSTLLGVLTFVAVKTMFMVSILLVLAVSSLFKHKLGSVAATGAYPLPLAYPQHLSHAPHKEVHLHVHTDPHRQQSYGPWQRHGDEVYHHGPGYHGYHEYQAHRPSPSAYSSGPPGEDLGYYDPEQQSVFYRRAVHLGPVGHPLRSAAAPPVGDMSSLYNH